MHPLMNLAEAGRKLPQPRALLIDLDGTLYKGSERIPGADRLIDALHALGIPAWFVTNNSSRTPEEVADHLTNLGIAARPEQVVTSALAAADYAGRNHPDGTAYVIGERGLREALADQRIRMLPDATAGAARRVGEGTGENETYAAGHATAAATATAAAADAAVAAATVSVKADIVVQGIDRGFDYDKLATAVRHVRAGAAHILTNPDLLLPSDGGLMPGAGSLGAAVAAASGREPIVIGKPSAILMNYTLARANARPDEVWVVGDNPATDIAAARNAGCASVLVLTGLCTADDWEAQCLRAQAMPDAVCADLDELTALLPTSNGRKG